MIHDLATNTYRRRVDWAADVRREGFVMVSVVNGYVCLSSCDEDSVRKGHDPRNPKDNPAKTELLAIRDGKQAETKRVSFGENQSTVGAGPAPTDGRRATSPALVFDVLI